MKKILVLVAIAALFLSACDTFAPGAGILAGGTPAPSPSASPAATAAPAATGTAQSARSTAVVSTPAAKAPPTSTPPSAQPTQPAPSNTPVPPTAPSPPATPAVVYQTATPAPVIVLTPTASQPAKLAPVSGCVSQQELSRVIVVSRPLLEGGRFAGAQGRLLVDLNVVDNQWIDEIHQNGVPVPLAKAGTVASVWIRAEFRCAP